MAFVVYTHFYAENIDDLALAAACS